MKQLVFCLIACAVAATGVAETNLVRNPSFEVDADGDGAPDEWAAAGDSGSVTQTLSLGKGRDGNRCAQLSCTRFRAKSPASHAMLCQMGLPVRRGRSYRVTLWARGENILSDTVSLALSDTSTWSPCGLGSSFAPLPEWQRFEFLFRATRDCSTSSRFQMWFTSTGTLWVDDVEFVDAGSDARRPGQIVAPGEAANRVPNASFECGADGWGSAEWDRVTHWGGRLNRLFGTIDKKEAYHGECSLRIELNPKNQPVSFFDYFDLHRMRIQAPLAASIGFIEVEPGTPYSLSVYLKAAEAGAPGAMAVRQFDETTYGRGIRLSKQWERYQMTFTPTSRWCYVLAGTDLRVTEMHPNPPRQTTVWVDAIQLEKGPDASAFRTREPVEFGIATDKVGNVFGWEEPVSFRVTVANSSEREQTAGVALQITDFFDNVVWRRRLEVSVPAGGRIEKLVLPGSVAMLQGFLRLRAGLHLGEKLWERTMRLSVIPLYEGDDSRFGVNHAYPWPHLLELSRKAGLVWVRDWSLKWKDVEPEKSRFTFVETDHQIDRPLSHGLRVLGLLPFPSSPWSSVAPAAARDARSYEERRAVIARAPRDMTEFEDYVERTVAHYKGRITWFQVFNEPLFTSYALPRNHGYDGATYARYTKAFAEAARRANPRCKILAGIGYLGEGQIMDDFDGFFGAGGLAAIDAVDIHYYPRIRPPEFFEALLEKLNSLMEKHGGRKPIWLTEYGYYADDEPWAVPMPQEGFNQPLRSERVQAEYAVRWAAILFANGVEKVFYHAGTCAGVNKDSLQGVFYEYAGEGHKIYAAQAVMSRLLSPGCRFLKRLRLGDGVHGYLFREGERMVAVVWAAGASQPKPIRLRNKKLTLVDIMGRKQPLREFTPTRTPVYVVGEGIAVADFEAALR